MANVFVNPYANQGSMSWSLQNCFLRLMTDSGSNVNLDTEDISQGILAATESVQLQFARQISTRYPLAGKKPIKIVGVPSGTCTLGTILGPYAGIQEFLKAFGSTCNPFSLMIKQKKSTTSMSGETENCTENTTDHYITLKNCLGTQVQYTIQMQENIAVAQGNFVITFDTMDWSSEG